jgi:hypothetical protein
MAAFAVALATAFVSAPAQAAGPPDVVGEVVWVAKCVGDSLGGNSCHQ